MFLLALHGALYRSIDQQQIHETLVHITKGNWTPFLRGVRKRIQEPYSTGVYLSVFCAEDWRLMCREPNPYFPFCAHITQECANWPHKAIQYEAVTIETPTLILGGKWDPISPPGFFDSIHKQFSHYTMIEFVEEAHGVALTSCGRSVIQQFLQTKRIAEESIRPSCRKKMQMVSAD